MKNSNLKFNSLLTLFFIMAITLFSCSKDGEVGPQGEQGAIGAQGEQGIQGEIGPKGEDGNANVYTITYNLSNVDFGRRDIVLMYPEDLFEIGRAIYDSGAVLVYLNHGTSYYMAPGIGRMTNNSHNHLIAVEDESDDGGVVLSFLDFDGNNISISSGTYEFAKIIMISSTTLIMGRGTKITRETIKVELKLAGIDITDYDQVAEYFGLED